MNYRHKKARFVAWLIATTCEAIMNPQVIPVNTPSSVATRFSRSESVSRIIMNIHGVFGLVVLAEKV